MDIFEDFDFYEWEVALERDEHRREDEAFPGEYDDLTQDAAWSDGGWELARREAKPEVVPAGFWGLYAGLGRHCIAQQSK